MSHPIKVDLNGNVTSDIPSRTSFVGFHVFLSLLQTFT